MRATGRRTPSTASAKSSSARRIRRQCAPWISPRPACWPKQLNVEVISNNIANLNTTGFKRQRAEFQDLLYQSERRVGSASSDQGQIVPTGVQVGIGVKAAAVYSIAEQGNLTNTANPLDNAIQGNGFFQIEMPDGTTAVQPRRLLPAQPDRRDRHRRRPRREAGPHRAGRTP